MVEQRDDRGEVGLVGGMRVLGLEEQRQLGTQVGEPVAGSPTEFGQRPADARIAPEDPSRHRHFRSGSAAAPRGRPGLRGTTGRCGRAPATRRRATATACRRQRPTDPSRAARAGPAPRAGRGAAPPRRGRRAGGSGGRRTGPAPSRRPSTRRRSPGRARRRARCTAAAASGQGRPSAHRCAPVASSGPAPCGVILRPGEVLSTIDLARQPECRKAARMALKKQTAPNAGAPRQQRRSWPPCGGPAGRWSAPPAGI